MNRRAASGPAARRGVLACLAAFAALACAPPQDLLVASAVSLREPMVEIAARFVDLEPGIPLTLTFGASSVIAAQIRAGAPVDVFVSADDRIVDRLVADGLVADADRYPLARNRLVVIAGAGLMPPPQRAEDLLDPRVRRVAIAAEAVPAGRYARAWLRRRGLFEALHLRLIATEHARATVAAVDAGHAEVAIVYATHAHLARSARVAFPVPDAEQPRIVYTAALLRAARRPERAARLLRFLRGDEAARVLSAAGFAGPTG